MSDVALIRAESERTKEALQLQIARAEAFVISDDRGFQLAQDYVREVKQLTQALKEKRDEYVTPLKQAIDLVTRDVKPRLDTAAQIETILKAKCVQYRADVERLRLQAQREAQLLMQVNAPVQDQRAALVRVAETTAPRVDGVSYARRVVAVVVDPSKVPERYWVREISQAAIDLDVVRGVREIPGVEIKEIETMRVRT